MNKKLDRWIEEKLQNTANPKKIKTSFSNKKKRKNRKPTSQNQPSVVDQVPHPHPKRANAKQTHKPQQGQKPKQAHNQPRRKPTKGEFVNKVRIIPLGGLNEVGKNMMVIEYGRDIMIIDMGFEFPSEDMLGIDYVIPDISWLRERKDRIRGVILTHGHLDHIGGIPYMLPELGFPQLYGTKLTMGLVEKRVEEFGIQKDTVMNVIDPKDTIQLGAFKCNFFRVNHSIPDGVGVVIETPEGRIVHTGDFKFDYTPADGIQADFDKISALGKSNNVTIMFSDSTNATKPGHTVSEQAIGETLDMLIRDTDGRIIIASFSSLIGRIQQILNAAQKYKRQVFLSGRSIIDNIGIAERLGYIKVPKGLIHDLRKADRTPGKRAMILTTGSQGESMSALTRISLGNHKNVKIKKGDTVVISATPIVGNERAIYTVIDNLTQLGARVIDNKIMDVHTSGHGSQEDLKMMINMVKPKYFSPIHGQYFMRSRHIELAIEEGVRKDNAIIIQNGNILEMKRGKVTVSKEKADTNYILVDGLGMGDKGSKVLADRQMMAENGLIMATLKVRKNNKRLVSNVELVTRGFIYQTESNKILEDLKKKVKSQYGQFITKHQNPGDQNIQQFVASVIDKFTHKTLARRPLIVVNVVQV
ncbi:ribonuclease J [Patescibacteria group bacterium]